LGGFSMTAQSIENAATIFCLLANIWVAFSLMRSKVYRVFPFLCAFVCLALPDGVLACFLGSSTALYFYSFIFSSSLFVVLYLLMAGELCIRLFRSYNGPKSLRRRILSLSVAAGLAVSAIAGYLGTPHRGSLGYLTRVEGLETLALCTFLAVLFFSASRILPAIQPQIVRHGIVLGLYFLVNAAVLLPWTWLRKPYAHIANDTMLFVESGCYLAWAALFWSKTVLKNAPPSNRSLTAAAR
jgi:hypothetical protein